jgi:hypothetical protein
MKPDISATGNIIFASGNIDFIASALNINRKKVAPGAKHNYNGGTSMSSPIVAGAVALYLQENPNAWWYEVKAALTQTARRDTFTGPVENNIYGYGKLDAFQLVQYDAVLACMDDTMFNYNPNANIDDGSCIPFIYGCTDTFSLNFDTIANTDDGSCIPIVLGCTDSLALNYNSQANTDDGSCQYPTDTTGIKDLNQAKLFSIQPNPGQDIVAVQLNSFDQQGSYTLSLSDLAGRQVALYQLSSDNLLIDISDLASGLYEFILFDKGMAIDYQKLIKE